MPWFRFCPLLAGLLALCLFGGQACSPPAACKNDRINDGTLDPTGSSCTKSCECNNQSFRGACVVGKCVAFAREDCESKGAQRVCPIEESLGGTCRKGIQVCKPDYLTSDRWGDCEPNCQACDPNKTELCYDGPAGTLNIGICASGIRTCTADKTWGACEGQKVPTAEVCNGKDDDCNGKIDDNCTNPTENSPDETPATGQETTPEVSPEVGPEQTREEQGPQERTPETPEAPDNPPADASPDASDGRVPEPPPETLDSGVLEPLPETLDGGMREMPPEAPSDTPDTTTQEVLADTPDLGPEKAPEKPSESCLAGQKRTCLTNKQGECALGSQQCNNGIWDTCQSNKSANTTERCDGKDDDCDGATDEGCTCITGQVEKCGGTGACAGSRTCDQSGQWGPCQGVTSPQTETCNGKDDDCNGSIDENLSKCVTTVAGGSDPYYLDGPAKDARFGEPWGLTSDLAGNFYVADTAGHRIRKIDTKGNVTTIAGSGTAGFADSTGTSARFNKPQGIALDATGNLYVADSGNHRIRKIDPSGKVTTLAGSGTQGATDAQGTAAQFSSPSSLALDATGNLYVADSGNHRIRKIDTSGKVTTIAGDGTAGFKDDQDTSAQFNDPNGLALDTSGNLYVADTGNHRIRQIAPSGKVTTFAGNGIRGYADGPKANARFNTPWGLALDATGNLYVATFNRIRQIDKTGQTTSLAGNNLQGYADGQGTGAKFRYPRSMVFDPAGNLTVADSDNNLIRKVDPKGNVTTFAGSLFGYRDGKGIYVQFRDPMSVQVDSTGNLYVADANNHRIRKIDTKGNVTTFAGSGTRGTDDGQGTSAQFYLPSALLFDASGNLYVADAAGSRIRKIDSSGKVTTIAGSTQGYLDAQGTNAQFFNPRGLAIDVAGNLYVADANNNRIRKIDTSGKVTTFAGDGTAGFKDDQGTSAQFYNPRGLAFDGSGNLYVADYGNHRIRKIDTSGKVTTFAGSGARGFADGQDTSAQFYNPQGLAIDAAGNLYVTGTFSHRVRKIDPQGNVTTIAGSTRGFADGPSANAKFSHPHGLTIDAAGNLYIADTDNHSIRKIIP